MITASIIENETAATDYLGSFFNEMLYARLTPEEQRELYSLSSWFWKGLRCSRAGELCLAGYYFERGEGKSRLLQQEGLLWQTLLNEYLPKKAYYLYKTGDQPAAEKMLLDSMDNMRDMETQGWEFMLYSRVQQYHNLARMYFAYRQTGEAVRLVSDILVFLLSGHSELFPDLNVPLRQYPEQYELSNYLFIVQLFFETMDGLIKFPGDTRRETTALLRPLLQAARSYRSGLGPAMVIRECLLLFEAFLDGDYTGFCRKAEQFISAWPEHYTRPKHTLGLYIGWCHKN